MRKLHEILDSLLGPVLTAPEWAEMIWQSHAVTMGRFPPWASLSPFEQYSLSMSCLPMEGKRLPSIYVQRKREAGVWAAVGLWWRTRQEDQAAQRHFQYWWKRQQDVAVWCRANRQKVQVPNNLGQAWVPVDTGTSFEDQLKAAMKS